jgi:hypothetical protein
MSYYFVIIGTQDNPLFEYEFGTAKQGGDGIARFPEQARHMNQFIVHSSLDIVEEVQWGNGQMYVGCAALDLHLLTVSEVSQVHRSVLQQLRLLLDDGRQYVSIQRFYHEALRRILTRQISNSSSSTRPRSPPPRTRPGPALRSARTRRRHRPKRPSSSSSPRCMRTGSRRS